MLRINHPHPVGRILSFEEMEDLQPGSAKLVAYGLQEVRRIIRKASREADEELMEA